MAIIMISDLEGQTAESYERVLELVQPHYPEASGFLMHSGYPTDTGWRVVELWESREEAGRFFAQHVAPNLPKGIHPKAKFEPLHTLVQR